MCKFSNIDFFLLFQTHYSAFFFKTFDTVSFSFPVLTGETVVQVACLRPEAGCDRWLNKPMRIRSHLLGLHQLGNLGLSENSVPLNPMVLLIRQSLWKMAISLGRFTQHFQTKPSGEKIFVAQFQRPKRQIIPLYSWNFQTPWQIVAIDDGLTGPNSIIQWPPWVPQLQTHFFVGDTPPFLSSHDLRPKMARFVFFLLKK